jgi:hypothetical protein
MADETEQAVDRRTYLKGVALAAAATLVADSAQSQPQTSTVPMSNDLTADEIIDLLKLEPNATCGFVRVTFVSSHPVAKGGLQPPFAMSGLWDPRSTSW